MVYNRDSAWFHLYVAYQRMLVEGAFAGLDVHAAFTRTTDGPDCPIARSYPPREFAELCGRAGFDVEFKGGYLSQTELYSIEHHLSAALADERLGAEHREFLGGLSFDDAGLPLHSGVHAGIGGTYRVTKR
jgi:hypothetical protein